ncbi:MAG: hypothetical protein AB4060_15315 [Crocosphaera sp.]
MTPEERLSQIETLLETAASYIVRHEEAVSRQEERLNQLDEQNIQTSLRMAELAEMIRQLGQYQQEVLRRVDESHERIDRIWEYLSSQNGNGRSGN